MRQGSSRPIQKHIHRNKRQKEFELFGYDFLIDEDLRTWLLEVNNNPYLGTPNNYIRELLPIMIDEMFNLVVDPLFPPKVPCEVPLEDRQFTLIYSEPPLLSKRLRNERNLGKNYYPIVAAESSTNSSRPSSISKFARNDEPFQSERESKPSKYNSPTETIKLLLDTYCYSDYEPFELPVSLLLSSLKLTDPALLDVNLKSLRLVTDTRIHSMLA